MVMQSSELLAVSRRWFKANIEGRDFALRDFLSDSENLRLLGSASDENWQGEDVRAGVDGFFGEKPQVLHYEERFAEAFESGAIGWSLFVHRLTFVNKPDTSVEFRDTLIFALERGSWRIIHRHGSSPVPNEETLGVYQRPIHELAEAARKADPIKQTEGLASVMFTDIVSSSVLAQALGDRMWSQTVTAHFSEIRRVVELHGGQFVKSLGDGTMSSFASARSAMAAAVEVQRTVTRARTEPHLGLRIGIHTGDVVQEQDDFFGTVVNVAARITDTADMGEVRVSDVTRALVGADPKLAFTPLGEVSLAGQAEPKSLHALVWET